MSAPSVKEAQIVDVATATTVTVSTSAWTKVPTGSPIGNRSGVLINNPSTNNAGMVGVLSTNSSSPTEATTVRPLEFSQSSDFTFLPISSGVYLYMLSLHSVAESVHVQEVVQ